MKIKGENYTIAYDPATTTIICQGGLLLYGIEGYLEISDLLNKVVEENHPVITLNIEELVFLNSSGINTIAKFVIRVRDQNISQLVIQGSNKIFWQKGTLKNLQQLMPNLKVELV